MKIFHTLPMKALLILLCTLFCFTTCAAWALAGSYYAGYYGVENYYQSERCAMMAEYAADSILSMLQSADEHPNQPATAESILRESAYADPAATNFRFYITNPAGAMIYSNFDTTDYGYSMTRGFTFGTGTATYTLHGFVASPLTAEDGFQSSSELFGFFHDTVAPRAALLLLLAGVSLLLTVVTLVLLLLAVGHRRREEAVRPNTFDRIPYEFVLIGLLTIFGIGAVFLIDFFDRIFSTWRIFHNGLTFLPFSLICGGLGLLAMILSLLALLCTTATRCKTHTFLHSFLTARILFWFLRQLRLLGRVLGENLNLVWQLVLILLGYLLLNFLFVLFAVGAGSLFILLLCILFNLACVAAVGVGAVYLDRIKKGAERMAAGDLGSRIDTTHMRWAIKAHAETLNHIGDGLIRAVDERVRSERMRTELITNVSHDIKTPLTSIINYVDLLEKEPAANERAAGYLEVLHRQAARLKKLTEDIVEASKASTGNIPVSLAPVGVGELIEQVTGEYAERLETARLEAVTNLPAHPLAIWADGRLLWRVFDNLLQNICKYALEGTRVYLSAELEEGQVALTLKNISRDRLGISADELMERFVRGDSARSTEGSGLGLSIARSLTELMHGRFALAVDGDLFKVTLSFPQVEGYTASAAEAVVPDTLPSPSASPASPPAEA